MPALVHCYYASYVWRLEPIIPPSLTLPLRLPPLSGRFDESVIEERRKAAEDMLLFTTSIPALYNSPQLKEFFRVRTRYSQAT